MNIPGRMPIRPLTTIFILLMGSAIMAQVAPHKFFIEFKDKEQNPWSLDHPEQFLTQRAIQRRLSMGIPYEMNDLPVTPQYLQALQNAGAEILNPTKWLNGATIYLADTTKIRAIMQLPFVKTVVKNTGLRAKESEPADKFAIEDQVLSNGSGLPHARKLTGYDYGESWSQIHLVNGDVLHANGFRGKGILIAQLDAGFYNVNNLPGFDSLRANNQILGYKDFVKDGINMFDDPSDTHGMNVLSVMAGILPGEIIGTAPEASFLLLRTEEKKYEYETEEYNWVSGAEFADSAGADIITSSLGYTVFDSTFKDHSCAEMNGYTSVASRGANIAFSKGMVMIAAAGNEGNNNNWRCVSTPADAYPMLAVAATDSAGIRAGFSSVGVATPGRVKPNVAALGAGSVVMAEHGSVRRSNGTSFATPVIAGMTACLMQARRGFSNTDVKKSIERSGSQILSPDSLLGFGIPDFVKAINIMEMNTTTQSNKLSIYPNPFSSVITIRLISDRKESVTCIISDAISHTVFRKVISVNIGVNDLIISDLTHLLPGIYTISIRLEQRSYSALIAKVTN